MAAEMKRDSRSGAPVLDLPAPPRPVPIAVPSAAVPCGERFILEERLEGESARLRATRPRPEGAGLSAESVRHVRYLEAWVDRSGDDVEFRLYSSSGELLALLPTTRSS
jgi:hypothetical protein